MRLTFEGTWADIRHRLRPGTTVRNWSADKGYTGNSFLVGDVDGAAVTVSSEGISKERRISKGEFEKVFKLWPRYRAGQLSRSELGDTTKSQNTTYVISIFNWTDAAPG